MSSYFKHFVDAHEGVSLQTLMDEFEHKGPCCYWILVELCTKKFWENAKENPQLTLKKLPTSFRFHRRVLLESLRVRSVFLRQLLTSCQKLELLSSVEVGSVVEISMPKILEIQDRASKKRARERHARATKETRKRPPRLQTSKTKNKVPPNPQTAAAEGEGNEDDKNQLLLPGVLKPSADKSALELLEDTIQRNNAADRSRKKTKELTPAKDVISKIIPTEGR